LLLPALRRVNAVIVSAASLEVMLTGVLDEMLELFECDRAFFQFPCDPAAPTFTIPMERTRPEWPGAGVTGEQLPMTPHVQAALSVALSNRERAAATACTASYLGASWSALACAPAY
jgi:hypothetical protein